MTARLKRMLGNRKPRHERPIFIMQDPTIKKKDTEAVLDGVSELVRLTGENGVQIKNFGVWRSHGYIAGDGSLEDWKSIDWYMKTAEERSKPGCQVDAVAMINLMICEPWRHPDTGGQDHYDVFVTSKDLYGAGASFLIGLASGDFGTVLSTDRFQMLDDWMRYECIKTETMHELGHVLGLVRPSRRHNIEESIGTHCTNKCIMRQGLRVPYDWVEISKDRLKHGALCGDCKDDLRYFFNQTR